MFIFPKLPFLFRGIMFILFLAPRDNVAIQKSPPGQLPRYDRPRKLETCPVGCSFHYSFYPASSFTENIMRRFDQEDLSPVGKPRSPDRLHLYRSLHIPGQVRSGGFPLLQDHSSARSPLP